MTHDEMIEVIAHHKNGGKVECKCKGDGVWIRECHLDEYGYNFADFDYRAKPEPMVVYVEFNSAGKPMNTQLNPYVSTFDRTVIKFVEATE